MGFIKRLRNVTEKKVKAAEERYSDELRKHEADLDAELEGEDPALRRARERVRALREQQGQQPQASPEPAQKPSDPPPSGNRPRSL
jgi:hypothetical protein